MISNYYPLDPRAYLREELEMRKQRRPQYSLRAFARDLEMSPSYLSEFLNGHQGMSKDRCIGISRKINLSEEQAQHFWDLIESEFGRGMATRNSALHRVNLRSESNESRISVERFKYISDWYHLPLIELIDLKGQVLLLEDMEKILGVSRQELELALQRLQTLDVIEPDETSTGIGFRVKSDTTVSGGVGDEEAVRICHHQNLVKHAEMVEQKSTKERESLSVAFSIATKDWSAFQKECREAMLNVITKYAGNEKPKDQLIHFCGQAYTMLPNMQDQGK